MKVGILGGSFNPVHTGHVRMAIEVRERLGLDRVELVPAAMPPHKEEDGLLPFELRVRLVDLALEGIDGLYSNSIEGRRPGPSYTCDTITCYRTEQPSDEFYFLMGVGTFMELPDWKDGQLLAENANLVCVNRWVPVLDDIRALVAAHWPEAQEEQGGREPVWRFSSGTRLHYLEIPRLDIKGGEVRRRWMAGRDLTLLVPSAVERELALGGVAFDAAWGERAVV